MGGLYNSMFGTNEHAGLITTILQARQRFEVGRFRDAFVEADGERILIRIHTRNGGGNREDQVDAIESMQEHPWYVRDADDNYDYTYADFYFEPDLLWIAANLGESLATTDEERAALADETAEGKATIGVLAAQALVKLAAPPIDMRARWEQMIADIASGAKPVPPDVAAVVEQIADAVGGQQP